MGTSSRQGVSEITLGDWLDRVDALGWGETSVWEELDACARAAARRVVGRRRAIDPDALVSDLLVIAREGPEDWRRLGLRGVGLARWLAGVARTLLRARPTRAPMPLDESVEVVAAAVPEDDGPEDAERSARLRYVAELDAEKLLTPKQLASWREYVQGHGSRRAATRLGITRDAHRDRLSRALEHLRTGIPAPAHRDPRWLSIATTAAAAVGRAKDALLLGLRAAGRSYAACAAALDLTRAAVTSRLARLWRRARDLVHEAPAENDLPCLPSRDAGEPAPSEGEAHGDARPLLVEVAEGVHPGADAADRPPGGGPARPREAPG